MPMYSPGNPGLQQIFYAQGHPAFIPPQPGFGYLTHILPGSGPSRAPMPNFFVPMAQQGQQGLHPTGIITGVHAQQGVSLMCRRRLFEEGVHIVLNVVVVCQFSAWNGPC